MADQRFEGVRACVFDAYGTLFDVHSAVARHSARLGDDAAEISRTWRAKQLEYTWLRSLMGRYAPFSSVTADALDYALETFGVTDAALREDLLAAYRRLDAYPEAAPVLDRLRAAGRATAILSNGDLPMLEDAVAAAGIGASLDAVLSVDAVGVYKPDPRVYALACRAFDAAPAEIGFVSANGWDAVGAAAYGFRVLWCNRFGARPERLGAGPALEARDLNGVLDAFSD